MAGGGVKSGMRILKDNNCVLYGYFVVELRSRNCTECMDMLGVELVFGEGVMLCIDQVRVRV